ncbi:MAG: cyclic 2,3-diphosphoglycerate synthase [Acidobacteriota bacterium]
MKKVLIMGAAGRDFHNFNVYFRDNPEYRVVAFTATQIPDIEGRKYPPELAGKMYPDGIPIYSESHLVSLIREYDIDQVYFSYSDVSHEYVMHKASEVLAAGSNFCFLGPKFTSLQSKVPVISVCAVRTGCGKSQTSRRISKILRDKGRNLVVMRHPMPYGNLSDQEFQRYSSFEDLDRYKCTIEEREEYEPHLRNGAVVFAGVDYQKILREAEKEAEIILWEGGNNDFPFLKSDLEIVVCDPHRVGHELKYHPGETNFRRADVIIINKVDTALNENVMLLRENIRKINPEAIIVEAASPIFVEGNGEIKNKRVIVVEDGPTLTHGEMGYGAGIVASMKYGAKEIVDPRPFATGSIKDVFINYPHITNLIPAMGYGEKQISELEETINNAEADLVIIATPIDLRKVIKINKPSMRVYYELQEIGYPTLEEILKDF